MELLLLEITESHIKKEEKQHYVYIKDFNRLKFSYSKNKNQKHFCMYCLQCFYSKADLENYTKDCTVINGTQTIELPKEGEKVCFKNHHKQLPAPFVMYADSEAITKKIDSCAPSNTTALFNNKRTLKFKAQPTNVFFATVNQMFGSSSQLPTTPERTVIKSNR